jgi:tetratricopeptide (TPR) repeat protein
LYRATGRHEVLRESYQAYSQALKKVENVSSSLVLNEVAWVLQELGQFKRAATMLGRIVSTFPSHDDITYIIYRSAMCLKHAQSYKESLRYWLYILDQSSQLPGCKEYDILLEAARVYELMGNTKMSKDAYIQCHRLRREDNACRNIMDWQDWVNDAYVWEDIAKRYQSRKLEPVLELDAWKQTLERCQGDRPDILWRCAILHWEVHEMDPAIEYATKAFTAENVRDFARRKVLDVGDDAWDRLLPWVKWRFDMKDTIAFSVDLQNMMRNYVYEMGGVNHDDQDSEAGEDGGEEKDASDVDNEEEAGEGDDGGEKAASDMDHEDDVEDGNDEGDDKDEADQVLAPGWSSALDAHGGVYYYNEATRESTYEFPEALAESRSKFQEGASKALPEGWEIAVDGEGGSYYYNMYTRESTYEVSVHDVRVTLRTKFTFLFTFRCC